MTTLAQLLKDLEDFPEAREAVNKAMVGKQGPPVGSKNGAGRRVGDLDLNRCSINRDKMTVYTAPEADDPPATIPLPGVPAYSQGVPKKRDYSREAPTGTSVSYALRRLEKEPGQPSRDFARSSPDSRPAPAPRQRGASGRSAEPSAAAIAPRGV